MRRVRVLQIHFRNIGLTKATFLRGLTLLDFVLGRQVAVLRSHHCVSVAAVHLADDWLNFILILPLLIFVQVYYLLRFAGLIF